MSISCAKSLNWTFSVVHYFTWKLEFVSNFLGMIVVTLAKNRLEGNIVMCFWECNFENVFFERAISENVFFEGAFLMDQFGEYIFRGSNVQNVFLMEQFWKCVFWGRTF